ncbi:N-6 DNA methylase [Lysinibacillus fusiformis]|uniref:N-6 DNA methylase n=1 Tax=Lysinibacillus fusiformis TaxID=28031 RepID=UPI0035C254E4|nr:N-6 DNA methylase [Lysinibacillus fusiformis]
MDNKELYLNQVQRDFDYIFEIIRGDYYLRNDPEGINFILKLIFLRFKSVSNTEYLYLWDGVVSSYRSEKIEKVEYLYEELMYRSTNYYRRDIFNRRDINIAKSQTLYTIEEIVRFLDNFSVLSQFNDELAELFYNITFKLIFFKKEEYYLTDRTISKLISGIVQIEENDRIFDPFIGTGGLLFNFINNNKNYKMNISGQDINPSILDICNMLFNLTTVAPNFSLALGDSVLDDDILIEKHKGSFNKVITHIPFNLPNKVYRYSKNRNYLDVSMNFIIMENIIELLNSEGKAYIVVPNNILFSGGKDKEARKSMIQDDLIEAVIDFSENKSFTKDSQHAVIILNKKKELHKKHKIFLVNIQDNNVERVIKTIRNYDDTDISRIVSLDTISNRDYNLNFSHYDPIYDEMKLLLGQGVGVSLRDVASIIKPITRRNHNLTQLNGIPYIRPSNLKKDSDEVYLDFENNMGFDYIEHNDTNKIITSKAVIVSLQGKELKPTIFDPQRSKYKRIVLSNGCLALIPNITNEPINIDYLYYQLYNPRVLKQINGYKRGSIVKRITYNDFLNVVISKPEYEKQLQYIKDQEEPLKELEKYKKLYEELSYEVEVERVKAENRIVNMLIHNVGKHISVIGHDVQLIAKVLKHHNLADFIYDKDEIERHNSSAMVRNGFSKKRDLVSVREVYERTKERLDLIEKTFTDTQKTVNLNLDSKDFEKTNVKELISSIMRDRKLYQPKNYDFVIDGDDAFFNINAPSFMEMIHVLINNAEEHAFINNEKNYSLRFNIKKLKDRVIINYSNNGAKFSMLREDFILAGTMSKDSHGSGLGGAYLNRVVISHNGSFEVNNTSSGTEFIFTFII